MKTVVLVHGWEGSPDEGWFPWLKTELEKTGFNVIAPLLPDSDNPRIDKWIPAIAQAVGRTPDENTYFVGHSMGCQAIARYLTTLPSETVVGGVIFVGGFFKRLTGLEDDFDVQETDKHWLNTQLDLIKVASHIKRSVAIFSDNDPYVPLDNQNDFKDKIGSEIIVVEKMEHMGDSYHEIPIILTKLLEISK